MQCPINGGSKVHDGAPLTQVKVIVELMKRARAYKLAAIHIPVRSRLPAQQAYLTCQVFDNRRAPGANIDKAPCLLRKLADNLQRHVPIAAVDNLDPHDSARALR